MKMKELHSFLTEEKKLTESEILKLSEDEMKKLAEEFIRWKNASKIKEHETRVYAIDFDNTIAYTEYPKIIKPLPYAVEVLQVLSRDPCSILILWTCRENESLDDALNYCSMLGIRFDYVNENAECLIERYGNDCRKIGADVYIDDKCYGGIKGVEKLWKDWYIWMDINGMIGNGHSIDVLA